MYSERSPVKGDSRVSFWMISHQELAKFAADVGLVNYMYLGVSYREMTYLPVGLDGQPERGSTNRITMNRSGGLESLECGSLKELSVDAFGPVRGTVLFPKYPGCSLQNPFTASRLVADW